MRNEENAGISWPRHGKYQKQNMYPNWDTRKSGPASTSFIKKGSYTGNLPLHELRPYSQPQTAAEEGGSEVWALSPKLPGQAQGKEQGYRPGGVTAGGRGGRLQSVTTGPVESSPETANKV